MRSFSGIADMPGVTLVQDEARSFLAHDRRRYTAIVMSLVDTWASTGTGAYSLSENGLYTVEAWHTFIQRLTERGIFSVSRFYYAGIRARPRACSRSRSPPCGRAARTIRARTSWCCRASMVATLLLCRSPFSAADLDAIERVAARARLRPADDAAQAARCMPMLRELLLAAVARGARTVRRRAAARSLAAQR